MSKKASFSKSVGSFVGALALIMGFRWIVYEPYVIPSGSMIPTLLINDHVVVSKFDYGLRFPFTKKWLWRWKEPKVGEIVVFEALGSKKYYMVKRLIAVGGDKVEFLEDGTLKINDKVVERNQVASFTKYAQVQDLYPLSVSDLESPASDFSFYLEKLTDRPHRILQLKPPKDWSGDVFEVPAGHVMAVGDNRDNSSDSRYWGFLPVENIMGRVQGVWLSCVDSLAGSNFLCQPTTIRWKRFFQSVD